MSENTIKFSKMVELNGINLKDPLNDLLPTDPNDERIYDQDLDGHPGVTVFVMAYKRSNTFNSKNHYRSIWQSKWTHH